MATSTEFALVERKDFVLDAAPRLDFVAARVVTSVVAEEVPRT